MLKKLNENFHKLVASSTNVLLCETEDCLKKIICPDQENICDVVTLVSNLQENVTVDVKNIAEHRVMPAKCLKKTEVSD